MYTMRRRRSRPHFNQTNACVPIRRTRNVPQTAHGLLVISSCSYQKQLQGYTVSINLIGTNKFYFDVAMLPAYKYRRYRHSYVTSLILSNFSIFVKVIKAKKTFLLFFCPLLKLIL